MSTPPCRPQTWIKPKAARGLALLLALAGCATDKDALLPHGELSMLDIWNHATGGQQTLQEARLQLRRPLEQAPPQVPYSRSAANELHSLFVRLPNPDLLLYVYPHLSGGQQAPVPGYSTVLPFYQRVHYALPGERQDEL